MSHAEAVARLLDSYVESQVAAAVGPVTTERDQAVRDRDRAREDVADRDDRITQLEADLAACRASHERRWLFAAEAKPRPGEATSNAGYAAAHDRLNAAVGGTLKGIHVFSGTTIPGSFGTGGTGGTLLARPDLIPVVNIKTPGNDMAGAVAEKYDAQFLAYLDSWHKQRPTQAGYLTIDHEPENPDKGINAEQFRQAWARYARLFLAHPIASHVTFVACFMGWTWQPASGRGWTWQPASGRDPKAWDPLPLLTETQRRQVVIAADIYFKATETAEKGWTDRAAPFFDYTDERGYRTAVFETALNNDAKRPAAECAVILRDLGARYKAQPSLELVAFYEATGPAAGTNAYIDTPEEGAALATWGSL